MTSQNTSRLPQVIRRYGEVAEAVNHREMRRSVEEIAHRWKPPPHEEEYRCEGWTHEGAFTKTIYQEALNFFGGSGSCHSPGATEAEVHEQIQISPSLEDLMDFVEEPLIEPPLSADRRKVLLENIKSGLKQQASSLGVDATNLELPEDLDVLYSTVMGINAAGVPAETNFTQLVYAHDERSRPPNEMPTTNMPVHPATVHFPLAFLSLSFTLDILAHTQPSLPAILSTSSLLSPTTIHTTSHSLLALGLLASIPAVLSGVQQAILSISKQGLFEADGKTIKEKNKVLISHAIGSDLAVAASTWLWWVRSQEGGNVTPKGWMVWAEVGVVGLLFASASGGGSLVYNYGMGFSSLKTAKAVQAKKTS
ncbi:unnamed protein product [Zymoseptoria tritici ST99CH_1E4]|uniref:DUF2231 domain-containing protein n=1 Tax=Zymoseptoria tritici ST99CH_1E4 TaxID=1276532 RepID=A0A2H1FIT6_ZYMTR|nr:unnamed protein product [Zymoseptoria tritici ST99CH_1E4]